MYVCEMYIYIYMCVCVDILHEMQVFELVCAGTSYYFQASNTAE